MTQIPERPVLTMPPEEQAALRDHIAAAAVFLEYGSGGSTVLAAESPGKTVFSVESDAAWLAKMQAYFAANPPRAALHMHHGDIGPTKAWGHPKSDETFRQWPGYALDIWQTPAFVQPNLVLIDGRFRVACFLATLFCTTAPVTVLFDDYQDRKTYHKIEELVPLAARYGRMARFDVTPMAIPPQRLSWVIGQFITPV
jgi:hypothetical protein